VIALLAGAGTIYLLDWYSERSRSVFPSLALLVVPFVIITPPYLCFLIGMLMILLVIYRWLPACVARLRKDVVAIFLVVVLLLLGSYSTMALPREAVHEREEYRDQEWESTLFGQCLSRNRAFWMREYAQGPFIADNEEIRDSMLAISGVNNAASYLEVADNKAIKEVLTVEFNMTLLLEGKDSIYDYESPGRYDPKNVEWQVLSGDLHVARMYRVNFIVLDHERSANGQYKRMEPFLFEERYRLFADRESDIYHYDHFEK